jgi:hypothetical protein
MKVNVEGIRSRASLLLALLALLLMQAAAQAAGKLVVHAEASEALMRWFDGGSKVDGVSLLLAQPAHQLMEPLLMKNEAGAASFEQALRCWSRGDTSQPDTYLIRRAYRQRATAGRMLKALRKAKFARQAYDRVANFFPKGYRLCRSYEVFLTSAGWKWGDAMSFSYQASRGHFVLSDGGTPAIIFNLTLVAESYGRTDEERMSTFANVLSHELFHAAYADYCHTFRQPCTGDTVAQQALDLMLNEGIAHYIGDGALLREKYQGDGTLKEREQVAFATLADSARVIFDASRPATMRLRTLDAGTFGRYWSKYICMSGLLMAYHVDVELGRQALCDCIAQGPIELVRQYHQLQQHNKALPPLPREIVQLL